jgi:hypothetical protein
VILAPTDFAAFSQATGTPYPDSAQQKAALTPIVSEWKSRQQAAAAENRGPNALAVGLGLAGAAGLGAAGLAAFNALRRKGLDDATAAQIAKETEVAAATAATGGGSTAPIPARDSDLTTARPQFGPNGPILRADGVPSAVLQDSTAAGSTRGTSTARQAGQYRARSSTGFHDPATALLDTPEKRDAFLQEVARVHGQDSDTFKRTLQSIRAMEVIAPSDDTVKPKSLIEHLSPQDRYGTTTAREAGAAGKTISTSRTKNNTSAQDGYISRDQRPQFQALTYDNNGDLRTLLNAAADNSPSDRGATLANSTTIFDPSFNANDSDLNAIPTPTRGDIEGSYRSVTGIDPSKASLFYEDSDHSLKPYIGGEPIYGQADRNGNRPVIYTGRRSDGSPITITHLRELPTDDLAFYERTGETHPALDIDNPVLQKAAAARRQLITEAVPAAQQPRQGTADQPLPDGMEWAPPLLEAAARRHAANGAPHERTRRPTDAEVEQQLGLKPGELAKLTDIRHNAQEKPDRRTSDREDQGIKGMLEDLSPSGKRFYDGVRRDEGAEDNNVYASVSGEWKDNPERYIAADTDGDLKLDTSIPQRYWAPDAPTLIDDSGFQSEVLRGSPALLAGERLWRAVRDHRHQTGIKLPPAETLSQWATSLAQQHGTDPTSVIKAAFGTVGLQGPKPEPAFHRVPGVRGGTSARALAAGTGDALDRVYTSLGMHAGADHWTLDSLVRNGQIKQAAEALANELPDLADVFGTYMPSLKADERLNVVAEGLSAGLKDLSTAVAKYPEQAASFGIGKGAGGFGVDGFLKSYVRDWVVTRGLQLDPSGQPTYRVPADAFDLIALDASERGRPVIEELQSRVDGSPNGITAALRIDRLVSSAQSTKEGDPNTNATRFAQFVFDAPDGELLSTALQQESPADIRLGFASRMQDDATTGYYNGNPADADITDRIASYGTLDRPNKILAARRSGTDTKADNFSTVANQVVKQQAWLSQNAEALEHERTNLNRGLITTPSGPISVGRGLVISTGQRGAFIAGDTAGVHTNFREETFNDEGGVPLDRQDDIRREDSFLPQDSGDVESDLDIQRPSRSLTGGLVTGNARGEVPGLTAQGFAFAPASPAEVTARQYAGSKLFFKSLGDRSLNADATFRHGTGALPASEAFEPRRNLRAYLAEQAQSRSAQARTDAFFAESPNARFRTLLSGGQLERNPAATGDSRAGGGRWSVVWDPSGEPVNAKRDLTTGALPSHLQSKRVSLLSPAERLEAGLPLAPPPGSGMDPHGTYGQKGVQTALRPPADPYAGLSITPRTEVPQVGSAQTAASLDGAIASRSAGRGEGFLDDSNRRDAIALATGYVDAVRKANAQMSSTAPIPAPRVNGIPQIIDEGQTGGVGRRGSTFTQQPITQAVGSQELVDLSSAPSGSLSQENLDRLNTLRQEMEAAVPAGPTSAERQAAKASITGDYWDAVVSRGGFRPTKTGSLNLNGKPEFTDPSDATIAGRVNFLRKELPRRAERHQEAVTAGTAADHWDSIRRRGRY